LCDRDQNATGTARVKEPAMFPLFALIQTMLGRMSGKLAGVVFSNNKGGQYVRQRVTGTNPATLPGQSPRRDQLPHQSLGDAAPRSCHLGGLRRQRHPAEQVGQPINIPALAHFVRSNVLGSRR
jgi:hypothetical protein